MKRILLIFCLIFILSTAFIYADDTQFFTVKVSPDVFLIFDTSGSMAWDMSGDYTYGDGSTGATSENIKANWYDVNGNIIYNPATLSVPEKFRGIDTDGDNLANDSRMYITKSAMVQVLDEYGGLVRWGIAKFLQKEGNTSAYQYRYSVYEAGNNRWLRSNKYPTIQYDGVHASTAEGSFDIVEDITQAQGGSNQSQINLIKSFIDNSIQNDNDKKELRADGNTPTGGALKGVRLHYGNDIIPTDNAKWCRRYFVVLLTDGEPNDWGGASSCYTEATKLRHTYVPPNGGDTALYVDIQTYVIGVGLNGSSTMDSIAVLGGTEQYYPANSQEQVLEAFNIIFSDILSKIFTYTVVNLPTIRNMNTSYEDRLYTAYFIPRGNPKWEGHLKAFRMPESGILDSAILDTAMIWDTHTQLYNMTQDERTRYIIRNGAMTSFGSILPAQWDTMLGIQNEPNPDSMKLKLFKYIYGDSNHANLGDIFHSSPLLIAKPNYFYEDDDFRRYRNGKGIERLNKRIVLAGSNDGLLHVIDDSTGNELYSIMFEDVIPDLKDMLTTGHRYFIDGEPTAADIWFPSAALDTFKDSSEWKTIAIVGKRQGGRAYNVLDLTDTYGPNYKFNFTSNMDTMLGETWSRPMIYKTKINISGTNARDRFFAFFGGGYWNDSLKNNVYNDTTSNVGRAIYILNLFNMCNGDFSMSNDLKGGYTRLTNASMYPMPSAATVIDTNNDSRVDILYIGDVAGQLWKVDLTDTTGSADSLIPQLIFATNSGGSADLTQPIFFAPAVTFDEQHRLWVFFGTGDRAEPMKKKTKNWIVALYDNGLTTATKKDLGDLVNISADGATYNNTTAGLGNFGWKYGFYDSDQARESQKVFSSGLIVGETIYFTVFDPSVIIDICASATGCSYLYKFNAINAGHDAEPDSIGPGIPQSPQVTMDLNGSVQLVTTTSGGGVSSSTIANYGTLRRLLWWKEL
jgi:Tfp pilus tip-associated adhesin PilY1